MKFSSDLLVKNWRVDMDNIELLRDSFSSKETVKGLT